MRVRVALFHVTLVSVACYVIFSGEFNCWSECKKTVYRKSRYMPVKWKKTRTTNTKKGGLYKQRHGVERERTKVGVETVGGVGSVKKVARRKRKLNRNRRPASREISLRIQGTEEENNNIISYIPQKLSLTYLR